MTDFNLSSKAMLARLSFTGWTAQRVDHSATDETEQNNNAEHGSGVFTKRLVPPSDLKEIQRARTAASLAFKNRTLIWDDTGTRLLPSAAFEDTTQTLSSLKADYEGAVSRFVQKYERLLQSPEAIQARLGKLYRESEFPTAEQVAEKFSVSLAFYPIPEGNDFRVNLNNEEAESIRRQITNETQARLNNAVAGLYNRIGDAVKRLAIRLEEFDSHVPTPGRRQTPIREGLLDSIRELAQVIPTLNVTADPDLDQIGATLATELATLEAEDLKQHSPTRQSVKELCKTLADHAQEKATALDSYFS